MNHLLEGPTCTLVTTGWWGSSWRASCSWVRNWSLLSRKTRRRISGNLVTSCNCECRIWWLVARKNNGVRTGHSYARATLLMAMGIVDGSSCARITRSQLTKARIKLRIEIGPLAMATTGNASRQSGGQVKLRLLILLTFVPAELRGLTAGYLDEGQSGECDDPPA